MALPPALATYLFLSRHARRLAEQRLASRLAQGRENIDRLDERRGSYTQARPSGKLVWFNAVAPTSAAAVVEIAERLLDDFEDLNFLVTTGSSTALIALEAALGDIAEVVLAPIDVHQFNQAFLDHFRPNVGIWTNAEFWPGLILGCQSRGIPLLLVNAQFSERSRKRWQIVPHSAARILNSFDTIQAQDAESADNLSALGGPELVATMRGRLQHSPVVDPLDSTLFDDMSSALGRRGAWLAALTEPGEEDIVAKAHSAILRRSPRMLLIIMPSDATRGRVIAKKLASDGWRVATRSNDDELAPDTEIVVADNPADGGMWYQIAPISFIGGSLSQTTQGHSPEAACAYGSAILFGPNVANYSELYAALAESGGAVSVSNAKELSNAVVTLLAPDKVAEMAHAAWTISSDGAEVTDAVYEIIARTIDGLP